MLIPNILSNAILAKALCWVHRIKKPELSSEYGNKIIDSSRFVILFKKKNIKTLNAMKMVLVSWIIVGLFSRNICDICDICFVQVNIFTITL